jgi:hypothetical protein
MAARKSRAKATAACPTTVAAYLASLTPDKRAVIEEARALVHRHIPNPHMFRHTFATDLLTSGVPIEEVAILLGHSSPRRRTKPRCAFATDDATIAKSSATLFRAVIIDSAARAICTTTSLLIRRSNAAAFSISAFSFERLKTLENPKDKEGSSGRDRLQPAIAEKRARLPERSSTAGAAAA